jgi:hypothetical protein
MSCNPCLFFTSLKVRVQKMCGISWLHVHLCGINFLRWTVFHGVCYISLHNVCIPGPKLLAIKFYTIPGANPDSEVGPRGTLQYHIVYPSSGLTFRSGFTSIYTLDWGKSHPITCYDSVFTYGCLSRPCVRSGRVRKISSLPRFYPQTDYAIPAS